jgi:23S rRNA (cytosine1962-C5)-methyltransferase
MQKIYSSHWQDYELIDAGDEKKLERWGNIITIRPERNAYFSSGLSFDQWQHKAHFIFNEESKSSGQWQALKNEQPQAWQIKHNQTVINLKLTHFKHLGIFPEQKINWDFIEQNIKAKQNFLNLFAYTGVASLTARAQGANVYHCDSVKQIIQWSRENMQSSELDDIHWIHEDALKFAQREVKREKSYDGIIMDPPAYGIGAKKERWKLEDKFPELLSAALQLKAPNGFILANTYSPRLPSKKIKQIATELCHQEKIEVSDLCIKSTTGKRLEYGQRLIIS